MKFNKEYWGKTGRQLKKKKERKWYKKVKWVTKNVIEKSGINIRVPEE